MLIFIYFRQIYKYTVSEYRITENNYIMMIRIRIQFIMYNLSETKYVVVGIINTSNFILAQQFSSKTKINFKHNSL